MSEFFSQLLSVFSSISNAVSPPLGVGALFGEAFLLYHGIRYRKKTSLLLAVLALCLLLLCVRVGFYRCSARYFLILLPVALLLFGYCFVAVRKHIWYAAWFFGIGILVFQVYKDFRLDPGTRRHVGYFKKISEENPGRRAAVFILDSKEITRFGHYIKLDCFKPEMYDVRTYSPDMPKLFWQRYIYLYDTVYVGFQPRWEQRFSPESFPERDICNVKLDYQEYKGRHRKKCVQFFRLDSADCQVKFPASTTSVLPSAPAAGARNKQNRISDGWSVFGVAEKYWRSRETNYICRRSPGFWQIAMSGNQRCTLRSDDFDFSEAFDCYIEYCGAAPTPLEIRLLVDGRGVYRDVAVAFLPLDGENNQRRCRITFYPEMDPEKVNASILIRLPEGGKLDIARLGFARRGKRGANR